MLKIFIAFSQSDGSDIASHVYRYYNIQEGYSVFYTEEIPYGSSWVEEIKKNIEECDIFLLIATAGAIESIEVAEEIHQAKRLGKRIIPCKFTHIEWSDLQKWRIDSKHGIEFDTKEDLVRKVAEFDLTEYQEGAPGIETKRKDDPVTDMRQKEPTTAVKTDKLSTATQKILVAGSREIRSNYNKISILAMTIGARMMHVDNWIMLNGGSSETTSQGIISVDHLVSIGAQEELRKSGDQKVEEERILTLHPARDDQNLHRIGKVEISERATSRLLRLDLPEVADAIITIEGSGGTTEIIRRAMELEKPVLPIACTGEASKIAWDNYEKDFLQKFGIKKPSEEYEMLTTKGLDKPSELADVVIKIIKDKMKEIPDNLEVGPSTHFTTDSWTLKDALGYQAYAHAIARFITHEQTGKPLCISIQAPWGGGKTTLMRMIQYKLDPKAVEEFTKYNKENTDGGAKMQDILRNMENPDKIPTIKIENKQEKVNPLITIWFNAWKYESTEQVWSGLVDTIIQQVSARLPSTKERELFSFQLHFRRINKDAIRQRFQNRVLNKWIERTRPRIWKYLLPIGISIGVAVFGWLGSNDSSLNSIENYIGIAGIAGLVTSVAASALQILQEHQKAEADAKEEDAKVNIQEYLDIPNYNTNIGFIHHVEKDLQRVFDIVDNTFLPMVIFIDDLDRCSPDKVASAMEAINLFLAGEFPNCVFVLGIDPEMVAAALEKAHSEVISKLKGYSTRTPIGWRFMDKFVQLPFVIPPSEREDLDKYIKALLAKKEESQPSPKNDNKAKSGIEQGSTNQRDVLIQKSDEQDVIQIQEGQEKSIDKDIERFSDQNEEIREVILRATHEFSSTNPREIKRFLNVFRFYYFLRAARISRSLSVPTLEQLTDWIILSLKWPEVTRWLQSSPIWEDGKQLTTKTESVSQIYLRLKLLEDLGEKCRNDSKKDWKTEIESMAELKLYSNLWIGDKGLENFFRHQGSISQEKRLSVAVGTGFF